MEERRSWRTYVAVAALSATLGGIGAGLGVSATAALGGGDARPVAAIYRDAAPGVVRIASDGGIVAGGTGGSGFVVDADGHVVTSAHVIERARSVQVSFGDGQLVPAQLVGLDADVDIAVLAVDAGDHPPAPLELGEGAPVRIGDPVVAIGAPFGLDRSLSTGIVSGLRRQISSPSGGTITGAIQTDAALNPGSSGAPLLDARGRVVGVATRIATESGANEGVGFAIPAATVARTVRALLALAEARAQPVSPSG